MENKDTTRENWTEILRQFKKGNSLSLGYNSGFLSNLQKEIDDQNYKMALEIRILDKIMTLTPIDEYIKIFKRI